MEDLQMRESMTLILANMFAAAGLILGFAVDILSARLRR
jgi:hypothetical protein